MQKSEQINELSKALCAAQSEIDGAIKDSTNPFFKSKYADLASVMEALKKPFQKNGLSFVQSSRVTETGNLVLVTMLLHSSGQWISGEYPVKGIKDDPQALGSATTYARRYALSAMCGVAQVDDDANAAMQGYQQRQVPSQPKPQTTQNAFKK